MLHQEKSVKEVFTSILSDAPMDIILADEWEAKAILWQFLSKVSKVMAVDKDSSLFGNGSNISSKIDSVNGMIDMLDFLLSDYIEKSSKAKSYKEYMAYLELCAAASEHAKRKSGTGGYVYVIEFSDGSVKVGKSKNPQQRTEHLSMSTSLGTSSVWISEKMERYGDVEKLAHAELSGYNIRGEYFSCSRSIAIDAVMRSSEECLHD